MPPLNTPLMDHNNVLDLLLYHFVAQASASILLYNFNKNVINSLWNDFNFSGVEFCASCRSVAQGQFTFHGSERPTGRPCLWTSSWQQTEGIYNISQWREGRSRYHGSNRLETKNSRTLPAVWVMTRPLFFEYDVKLIHCCPGHDS